AVGISKQGSEVLVECFENVAQAVEFWLAFVATAFDWDRTDFGVVIRESYPHGRLLLNSVAIHVDCFKDSLGEILLLRSGQLGDQQVQDNGEPLPPAIGVRDNRSEK